MKNRQIVKNRNMSMTVLGVVGSIFTNTVCIANTPLDPSRVIEFKISKSGLTRISIDNDSIEDVYAYPAEPDLITHHKSGHVFVTPDELDIPVYVTVITRRGVAQDLRLVPTQKKAEPVLLTDDNNSIPFTSNSSLTSQSLQEECAHILAQFIKGKVPDRFVATTVNETGRGEGPVEAVLDKAFQNTQFRVLVFAIKNESSERQTLDNKVFWGEGDMASAFDHATLGPKETARLFVIQHRLKQ